MAPHATRRKRRSTQTGGFSDVRRSQRQSVELRVVVQDEDGWEIGLDAVNIGHDGVFVHSPVLFEPGERHILIFGSHNGEAVIRIPATVARADEGRGEGMAGMGYQCDEMDDETWSSLLKLT